MTFDEAIKHCLEQAEENDNCADKCEAVYSEDNGIIEACRECAADHRQLADWLRELKELKAADVQPVKRGKWDFQGYQLFKCTNCTKIYTQEQLEDIGENWTFPNFCPNCGAKMLNE